MKGKRIISIYLIESFHIPFVDKIEINSFTKFHVTVQNVNETPSVWPILLMPETNGMA